VAKAVEGEGNHQTGGGVDPAQVGAVITKGAGLEIEDVEGSLGCADNRKKEKERDNASGVCLTQRGERLPEGSLPQMGCLHGRREISFLRKIAGLGEKNFAFFGKPTPPVNGIAFALSLWEIIERMP